MHDRGPDAASSPGFPILFEALGMSVDEQRAYLWLLPQQRAMPTPRSVGIQGSALRKVLTSLESKGLISRTTDRPPQYFAVAPDVAIEELLRRREGELRTARATVAELMKSWGTADPVTRPPLDLVEGTDAIVARLAQLKRSAKEEIRIAARPPYVEPPGAQAELDREASGRGVRIRTLYDVEYLATPGRLAMVHDDVAAGEEARTLQDLALKFVVIDQSTALVPLDADRPSDVAVVVHGTALVDSLAFLFDMLWERAIPIAETTTAIDEETEAAVTSLLISGLTDDHIARQLGISARTLQRRVAAMMRRAGVTNRLQLAYLAGRSAANERS